jgi:Recombination endonuclease VII
MPGKTPCPIGCRCGHHPEGNVSPEEKAQRARERARENYLANREQKIAAATEYAKGHREERRTRARERGYSRKYYAKNRQAITAKQRAAYDPALTSVRNRTHKFGLSPEETQRLFDEQGGRCYLGGEPIDLDAPRGYYVDHAHWCCPGRKTCGKCVRGLTCNNCNHGAGGFGDEPARLRRAADAIEAADAEVAARINTKPVQGELPIDIKRAARRQEGKSA